MSYAPSPRVSSKWCVEWGQGRAEDIGQDSSKNIPAHLFFTLHFRLVSFTLFSNYRGQIFVSECQTFTNMAISGPEVIDSRLG